MSTTRPVSRSTAEQRTQQAQTYPTTSRLIAEAFGTFLLVFGGVGTALFASAFPDSANATGVGFLGVALAFGLTVMAGIYAVGHISGGHFNPAVTVGLAIAGRTEWRHVPGYVLAQIIGGAIASSALALIAANGPAGYLANAQDSGFASNGFGEASPGGFGITAVIVAEIILTAVFVTVILSITSKPEYRGVAPIGIGLTLTLIHLISIPISNTSVNPARSIATALCGGPTALAQLWVFIIAPLVGAAIAGLLHRQFTRARSLSPHD
ncbi:aquaporin Z [Subtercola boreus]|uniref:Aquaporin Z n=1 Tax=Subtercola boreus TaxID=120213 RepID=A0A3E0VEM6_9MICO|nr:aquaporin Z [Subtercola boreus]RFA08191.1 aquaporin Z [Subtercola boreus]TQL54916.1 aquaporin Z [Subtercola boreus]